MSLITTEGAETTGRAGLTIQPGICWSCLCNDYRACQDPDTGENCSWANEDETFCSVCALIYAQAVLAEGEKERELGIQPAALTL